MGYPTAYFVRLPFQIIDLLAAQPHIERRYVIEKIVELDKIDYENFINDFCIERRFIAQNATLCHIDKNSVWHCIFVRLEAHPTGFWSCLMGKIFRFGQHTSRFDSAF